MTNESKSDNYQQNYQQPSDSNRQEYLEAVFLIEKDLYSCIELMVRRLRNAASSYEYENSIKLRKEMFKLMTDMSNNFDKILTELTKGQGQLGTYKQGKLF